MQQAFNQVYYIINQIINIMNDTKLIGLISIWDIFIGLLAVKIIITFFFGGGTAYGNNGEYERKHKSK